MIRFLGNIEAKTDAKGRVFIPAGFSEATAIRFRRKARAAQRRIPRLPGTLSRKRLVQDAKPIKEAIEQMERKTPRHFPAICEAMRKS